MEKKVIQLILLTYWLALDVSAQQSGLLDSTFNFDGIVTTDYAGLSEEARAVCLQPDSKIVIAGVTFNGTDQDFIVSRYNADGSIDSTFGGTGIERINLGYWEMGYSVGLDSSGGIIVAGLGGYIPTHSAVAKYKPNGALDSSFSDDGKLTTFFSNIQCHAMAVQPDGKIVLAGEVYTGSGFDFGIMRLNGNGDLDSSFQNGIIYTDFDDKDDYPRAIALQSDGKIVVAGFSDDIALNGYRSIARYNPDGTIDSSFNGGKISVSGSSNAIALQSNGGIVLGEHAVSGMNLNFGASRYLSIGVIDSTFGTNGESSIDISGTTDQCTSIAIQQDGKIVTAGHSWDGSHQNISAARFNSDGSLDVTFGNDGSVEYDISGIDNYCHAVAIQPDGKILLAGGTFIQPPHEDILLMRLFSGIGVGEQTVPNPSILFTLSPNPASQATAIEFVLRSLTKIRIDLFDLLGNKIKCVLNETQLIGEQKIILNTFNLQNGIYFLRFYADEISCSRKLIVTN